MANNNGVAYLDGITFRDDPRLIKLSDLSLRVKEKFLYEYDFIDQWRHLIRVEAILPSESNQRYPVCIGGKWAAPPEDCGGPWAFMERRDEMPCEVWGRFWGITQILRKAPKNVLTVLIDTPPPWRREASCAR